MTHPTNFDPAQTDDALAGAVVIAVQSLARIVVDPKCPSDDGQAARQALCERFDRSTVIAVVADALAAQLEGRECDLKSVEAALVEGLI